MRKLYMINRRLTIKVFCSNKGLLFDKSHFYRFEILLEISTFVENENNRDKLFAG